MMDEYFALTFFYVDPELWRWNPYRKILILIIIGGHIVSPLLALVFHSIRHYLVRLVIRGIREAYASSNVNRCKLMFPMFQHFGAK